MDGARDSHGDDGGYQVVARKEEVMGHEETVMDREKRWWQRRDNLRAEYEAMCERLAHGTRTITPRENEFEQEVLDKLHTICILLAHIAERSGYQGPTAGEIEVAHKRAIEQTR